MGQYDYDLAVIGGGAAGMTAALTAAGLDKKVAMIEQDKLGGECTWSGCVPSKALIKASKIAHQSRSGNKYGIKTTVEVDSGQVMNYVSSVIDSVYQKEQPEVFGEAGVEVVAGKANFVDSHTLQVDGEKLTAAKIIVATGSSPFVPPITGLEEVDYLTNKSFFQLEKLPTSLVILGGGAIGVELAQALNRLGVEVTVVEMQSRILAREEKELGAMLSRKLTEEGVRLLTGYKAIEVKEQGEQIKVKAENKAGTVKELAGEEVLVAVGRQPNVRGFNLDQVGVETDQQGIVTDKTLQTTVNNIYACGDVVGPYRFSHVSNYEGITAALNVSLPLPIKRKLDYSNLLWVTYTDPELAHLGLTEEAAREKYGSEIKIYEFDYADLDRAETDDYQEGRAKFICDHKNRLLGAHILGVRAGELIHESQILKSLGEPITELRSIMHAYPTYAELHQKIGKKVYVQELKQKLGWLNKLRWWN